MERRGATPLEAHPNLEKPSSREIVPEENVCGGGGIAESGESASGSPTVCVVRLKQDIRLAETLVTIDCSENAVQNFEVRAHNSPVKGLASSCHKN